MAQALYSLQHYDEAAQLFREVVKKYLESAKVPDQKLIDTQLALCQTLSQTRKFTEALSLAKEALRWQEQLPETETTKYCPLYFTLGQIYASLSDSEQAGSYCVKAFASLGEEPRPAGECTLAEFTAHYVPLIRKVNGLDDAIKDKTKATDYQPYAHMNSSMPPIEFDKATSTLRISQLSTTPDDKANSASVHLLPAVAKQQPLLPLVQESKPSSSSGAVVGSATVKLSEEKPASEKPDLPVVQNQDTKELSNEPPTEQLPPPSPGERPMSKKTPPPPPTKPKPKHLHEKYAVRQKLSSQELNSSSSIISSS